MKVLVDNRWDGKTGIGRLYREIVKRRPEDVIILPVKSKISLGNLFSPIFLGKEINFSHSDMFWSPSFMPPAYSKKPYVITIHDVLHMFYYSTWHKLYYKEVLSRLAKKAKVVITVSEYSKTQLVEHLNLHPKLVKVIYNGIDERFILNNDRFILENPYFLYVGNRRKNKNITLMLKAFASANIPNDFKFVMSGNIDKPLYQLIHDLKIESRIIFLGEISENDLPKVYRGAFATIYASLAEGFGLPILESMASGTPVITSNVTSLPEIAGGAAQLVDPLAVDSIKYGMESIFNDTSLYLTLVEKGLSRAKDFSWDETAKKTWQSILA